MAQEQVTVGAEKALQSEAKGLTPAEQRQYDILVKGFREAQRGQNAIWRQESLAGLLDKIQSGKNPEGLWIHHFRLEQLLHPVAMMKTSAHVVTLALEASLAETRKILDPVEELKNMEAPIRAIVDRMAPKARAIVGILKELASLDGLSLGVDFGQKILYEELADSDTIEKVCQELADDPEVKIMAQAHALVNRIEEAEAEGQR